MAFAAGEPRVDGPNVKLRIAPVSLDLGPGKTIRTVGYNGSVPGPILRLREGKPLTLDVHNDTDVPEVVHWHGQTISPKVDGSVEEGTPSIPARGHRQYRFTPGPAGTRWYHTHSMAHADLTRDGFSGQYGFAISNPPATKAPTIRRSASPSTIGSQPWERWARRITAGRSCTAPPLSTARCWARANPCGCAKVSGCCSRLLNASATDEVRLALPGHQFRVIAMDGNAVPSPGTVDVLYLDIAECGNKKDFNHWTINGKSFPDLENLRLEKGKRYRLLFDHDSGDIHPFHLHRHTFEITQVGDRRMSGLRKDVISVNRRSKAAVDFVANNPGFLLFHCHMQLHMDFGLMQLLNTRRRPNAFRKTIVRLPALGW